MKKQNIYIYGIIVIILILLYLLRGWWKDRVIVALGGYTHKETTIDTTKTYKKGKIDTLAIFNHYVETKGINLNPEPKIVYKYKYLNPVTKEEEVSDSLKLFNVAINDSLIDGIFKVYNDFEGDLIASDFKYKPKFPKFIKQVDTLTITIKETETLYNLRSKIGTGIGINSLNGASLLGSYTTKKDLQFIYEYNRVLNSTLLLNNTPIKDYHSIKVIKQW